MTFASFTLPLPPSLNNIFKNVPRRGRVKTDDYKAWLNDAGWEIKRQRVKLVPGEVRISLMIERPRSNADIDNRIKPVLDSLQKYGVIENDHRVAEISAKWAEVKGCHVMVFALAEAEEG